MIRRRPLAWTPIALAAVTCGGLGGCVQPSGPPVEEGSQVVNATPAPDLPLHLAKYGLPPRLSGLRGKVVLLDFWATWCEPCRMSIPDLGKLYLTYQGQGLDVIGISEDATRAGVNDTASDLGATYPIAFALDMPTVQYAYPHRAIPTMYLIDRRGRIRWDAEGYLPAPLIEAQVRRLLKE